MMVGLPAQAWERFGVWLVVGLVLYFGYGYGHSRLHDRSLYVGPASAGPQRHWLICSGRIRVLN